MAVRVRVRADLQRHLSETRSSSSKSLEPPAACAVRAAECSQFTGECGSKTYSSDVPLALRSFFS